MDSLNSNNTNLHEIILNNYLYIDKIGYLFKFLDILDKAPRFTSPNINMMIRPRGFGISLAMEAIEALLSRDELLEGKLTTKVDDKDVPRAPVIRLSLNKIKAKNIEEFTNALIQMLQSQMWEHHLKHKLDYTQSPRSCFSLLIRDLATKYNDGVVVLIDNYDMPFYIAMDLKQEDRDNMIAMYLDMLNAIKQSGELVRWCLVSGHLKFNLSSKLSEGLPLIHDYSYSQYCDTLFGFTLNEIKETYKEELSRFAPRLGVTVSEYLQALDKIYGGFVFSDRKEKVLAPASINAALANEGCLYPYARRGDFSYLSYFLEKEKPDLSWLFDKDGQDAIFLEPIPLDPKDKNFGSMLLQLGFVQIDKVTYSEGINYVNYRYRFNIPNEEMRRVLRVLLKKADPKLLTTPFNPQVYEAGFNDFDIESNI